MFELKVAMVTLLCIPLFLVSVWLISKLMDEVLKKNK